MNSKTKAFLSIVAGLTIESMIVAAAEPPHGKTWIATERDRAVVALASTIFANEPHGVEIIFNLNFLKELTIYDSPSIAINRATNIETAVQTALVQLFHDKSLRSLENPAGARFRELIQKRMERFFKELEATGFSEFENLPPNVQAEIAKNLSDKELARLAATSKRETLALQDEIKNRPSFYWLQPMKTITLAGHTGQINALTFSQDGATLISGSDDKSIILWDAKNYTEKLRITKHTGAVTAVTLSPDNKTIGSSSADYTVRLWDSTTGKQVKKFMIKDFSPVTFSHNNKLFAFVPEQGIVAFSDRESGQTTTLQIGSHLVTIKFSPDDKDLIGFNSGSSWHVLSLNKVTRRSHQVSLEGDFEGSYVNHLLRRTGNIEIGPWVVSFSPDNAYLALGTHQPIDIVGLWDVKTGKNIWQLEHTCKIESIAFSPDTTVLASGDVSRKIKIWSMKTLKQITEFKMGSVVSALAFAPDGKTLAVGLRDGKIIILKQQ